MYFKRLELIGFKSFADKTALKFEPGVTAIVGPNGCGKSNIADSIKWVLGEQSAKELRGSRMEDVIFNGTSNKEPINMAEVSLVLSNKDKKLPIDFEEVIITRRLFRSGESEYLINKMPVRLKDINDLLAGTGIGTSSYSIIEQGQIGQILSSKPEDRRYIFEEASGITKFKIKKKEALKKLEHTENNLVRLSDIIQEVQRQMQSIERQAKKAEKYKKDFDALKDVELKYSASQYKNIKNESKAIAFENDDLKKREEELMQGQSLLSGESIISKDVIKDLERDLQKTQSEITETGASIDKNMHTVEMDKERIEELELFSDNLEKEIRALEEKLKNRRKDLERYEKEAASITSFRQDKERELKGYEQKINIVVKEIETSHDRVKNAKEKIMDYLSSQTKTKNELIKLGADIQNRKARLRRLKIEYENIAKEKISQDEGIKNIDKKFDKIKNSVDMDKKNLTSLKEKMHNLEDAIKTRRDKISTYKTNKDALQSKLEVLNELAARDEGFQKSVKAIKEKARKEERNVKSVSDLIAVEAGFEKAVESLLGDLTQALIVSNRGDAYESMDFLKGGGLGRANFIIIKDAIDLKIRPPKHMSQASSPVLNFLKYDDAYKSVMLYLFRDAYIVESREEADRLFNRFKEYRFVTKDGYLKEGPRVLGGAILEADASIIGRGERIGNMESQIRDIAARLEKESATESDDEKSRQACRTEIGRIEEALRKKESEYAVINAERASLLNAAKKIEDESIIINTEIKDVEQDLDTFVKKGEELNLFLNKQEEEADSAQNVVLNCEADVKGRASEREEYLLKVANLKGELSNVGITCDNILENLNMRRQERLDIEKDINLKKEQIEMSLKKVEQFSDEIIQLEAGIKVSEENKKFLDAKVLDLQGKRDAAAEEFDRKEELLKEKEKELEILRNNIRDLEIKLTEINYKKASLAERVYQAYKTDLDTLEIETDENVNWDDIKERIAELKQKLENMGPVNLVAIEEHKELEERFLFLTRQKEDLVNAKESLHKAIIKINVTTRKLFMETFQKVQIEFRNYFRMLFGGGHAEVFLLDDGNILESGIEIVVRPPGKKLQNILLLSGGEKALTAIALLFAIFKVNPSPFCVLDEIDAPLDESNIDRFTRMLREFIKTSQFILITHNKKTIQMADILYGITMAEKGVSRIVSVRFPDENKISDKEEVMV